MPIRFALPGALLLCAVAAPVAAATDEPAQPPKSSNIVVDGKKDAKQKKVCETMNVTGSIMPKRVCRTVAESEQAQLDAQHEIDRMRDRQLSGQQVGALH